MHIEEFGIFVGVILLMILYTTVLFLVIYAIVCVCFQIWVSLSNKPYVKATLTFTAIYSTKNNGQVSTA